MKRALVVGGANGIGLSIATELAKREDVEKIYIVDKAAIADEFMNPKFEGHHFDLTQEDYSIFDKFQDIDTLMITAGFGRLALFENIDEKMIPLYFNVNTIPVMRIVKHILFLGVTMGAVMELIPRITKLFIDGLMPISEKLTDTVDVLSLRLNKART